MCRRTALEWGGRGTLEWIPPVTKNKVRKKSFEFSITLPRSGKLQKFQMTFDIRWKRRKKKWRYDSNCSWRSRLLERLTARNREIGRKKRWKVDLGFKYNVSKTLENLVKVTLFFYDRKIVLPYVSKGCFEVTIEYFVWHKAGMKVKELILLYAVLLGMRSVNWQTIKFHGVYFLNGELKAPTNCKEFQFIFWSNRKYFYRHCCRFLFQTFTFASNAIATVV